MRALRAVSYTHLDVYKRQIRDPGDETPTASIVPELVTDAAAVVHLIAVMPSAEASAVGIWL